MSTATPDLLETGRSALDRHDWQVAFDALTAADDAGALDGGALSMLTEAAWWSGHPEAVLDVGERAYRAYVKEGNPLGAAMVAFSLAQTHAGRMEVSIAHGWLTQAERLIADQPEGPVHAYLTWMRGFFAAMGQDHAAAIASFEQALEIARRAGEGNVVALSLMGLGQALAGSGRLAEGLALMDEAMAGVLSDELDPIPTGFVYCSTISLCADRADYQRAAEWTEVTTRWCERNSIGGFPGVCRIHRASILRLRGSWPAAEEEVRRACEELPKYNMLFGLGEAYYELGEVRRRVGDLVGAEEAYEQAHAFGRDPQPGISLLRLEQGKLEAAAAGILRVLAVDTPNRVLRTQPLIAQAEIALAMGDSELAAGAADELTTIADEVGTTALIAMAAGTHGAVRLAEADPQAAVRELRRALQGWQELDAPYEGARVRVLLGEAYRALGDHEGAQLELRTARDVFARLGATTAAERAGQALGDLGSATGPPERVRRAFMFTDIVGSTDLVRAIGDEAWEDVLGWHDQTLRSLFATHGGEVAHHTGDGFFVAFPDPASALAAAVAVQRALSDHRRQHGFALQVRIGVHSAEATRRGQDYSGGEVHRAARIAALGAAGEVLASADTMVDVTGFTSSEPREVALKGIDEPTRIVTVTGVSPGTPPAR